MIQSRVYVSMLALLAAGSLAGCSAEAGAPPEETSEAAQPILGASPATDEKYAAVGALVEGFEYPGYGILAFNVFCSATLIGPQQIVTARHCTPFMDTPTYP